MAKPLVLSRRTFLAGVATVAPVFAGPPVLAAPILGDDGNYVQDWYLQSFLDLRDDIQSAESRGKHFAIQWGQRGCSSCKKLHVDYFADQTIEPFVRNRFDIVHLDTYGERETVDLDGARQAEKALARRHRVRVTPSIEFYALVDGKPRDVARMTGLLPKPEFLQMFRYVDQKAYTSLTFDAWLRRQNAS